jgi:hypothetical protein
VVELPTNCQAETQTTPGQGAVQKMTKFSFRTDVLDLELVFLSFPSGLVGNLNQAAANISAEIERTSGPESLTPWKTTTISRRPARFIATKPDATHQARQVILIDDTRRNNQLIIVDVSYDTNSRFGNAECERIIKSAELNDGA